MKETKTILVAITYEIDLHKGSKKNVICGAARDGIKSLAQRAEEGEVGLEGFKLIHCEAIE